MDISGCGCVVVVFVSLLYCTCKLQQVLLQAPPWGARAIAIAVSTRGMAETRVLIKSDSLDSLSDDDTPLPKLPPLPEPDHRARRSQACHGITLVLSLCCVQAAVVHAVALHSDASFLLWCLVAAIYAEVAAGLACLAAILWAE